MCTFRQIRSTALEKVKSAKVFKDINSDENKKDDAFSKKGNVATEDGQKTQYDVKNQVVKVTEDIDQAYSDWQDKVRNSNPNHADKIKFKSTPDQRHIISAEHGDRSFGTFDMHKGSGELLGEAFGYRGTHQVPRGSDGISAPLHDMSKTYPEDIYSNNAHHLYGHGGNHTSMDKSTIKTIHGFRNKPEKLVDIYRAVPNGISKPKINNGDWVTVNKEYAKQHGQSVLGDDYQILSRQVPAKHVFNNGDSIHEFGYDKSEQTNEEVINEISKDTLKSYVAKSLGQKSGADFMRGVKMAQDPNADVEDLRKKSEKRSEGINKAVAKMSEESCAVNKNDHIKKIIKKARTGLSEDSVHLVKVLQNSDGKKHYLFQNGMNSYSLHSGSQNEKGEFKTIKNYPNHEIDDVMHDIKKLGYKNKVFEGVNMSGSLDQDYVANQVKQLAKKHSTSEDNIKKQLDMGVNVEKEHTDDMDVATKIALDHINEKPNYYSKLKAVEESTDQEKYQLMYQREAEVRNAAHNDGVKFAPKSDQIEIRYPHAIAKGHDLKHHIYHHENGKWNKDTSFTGRSYSDALDHLYGRLNTTTGKREPK